MACWGVWGAAYERNVELYVGAGEGKVPSSTEVMSNDVALLWTSIAEANI
jgi:hypothetical protein